MGLAKPTTHESLRSADGRALLDRADELIE